MPEKQIQKKYIYILSITEVDLKLIYGRNSWLISEVLKSSLGLGVMLTDRRLSGGEIQSLGPKWLKVDVIKAWYWCYILHCDITDRTVTRHGLNLHQYMLIVCWTDCESGIQLIQIHSAFHKPIALYLSVFFNIQHLHFSLSASAWPITPP